MEEPGRLQCMGSQRVGHDWATSLSLFTLMHWRRKWPLQCSCLGNPRNGGAWWVAVCGVTQSRTQLKRLSSSSRDGVGINWDGGISGRCRLNVTLFCILFSPRTLIEMWRSNSFGKRKKFLCLSRIADIFKGSCSVLCWVAVYNNSVIRAKWDSYTHGIF